MELYPYQQPLFEQLSPQRSLLAAPFGAGKTPIALKYAEEAFYTAKNRGAPYHVRAMVVCEASAITQWADEIRAYHLDSTIPDPHIIFIDELREYERTGTLKVGLPRHGYIVISHSRMRTDTNLLHHAIQYGYPGTFILDESTTIKNPGAKRSKAAHLLALTTMMMGTLRIALAGQPMPESEQEIWSQFEFLYPAENPYGKTYYKFLRNYFLALDYGYTIDNAKHPEFRRHLRNHCVTLNAAGRTAMNEQKAEKLMFSRIPCPLTAQQEFCLEYLRKTWSLPTQIPTVPRFSTHAASSKKVYWDRLAEEEPHEYYTNALSVATKEMQILSGFYYTGQAEVPQSNAPNPFLEQPRQIHRFNKAGKRDILKRTLKRLFQENPNRKVVVWSAFTAERSTIMADIKNLFRSLPNPPQPYNGSDHFDRTLFQKTPAPAVIVQPLGHSRSLNQLVVADTAIYYSNRYSQDVRDQSIGRLDRITQVAPFLTFIDLITPGYSDEKAAISLTLKRFANSVVTTPLEKSREQNPFN
ncbi:MAG: DEAD/DEAH box helicase [bacterium]|nr:DEAD/DEAH box helicase [bacterium]